MHAAPRPRLPAGFCGGNVARRTWMPRPLAWRTIESIAWSASEMPASCRFSRSLAPCISSTTSGSSRGQHRAEAAEVVLREVPGGAFVDHRDRLVRVAGAAASAAAATVPAWPVDHQQRRRGRSCRPSGCLRTPRTSSRRARGTAETLTPNVQLALWPRASVAVQVTVVVPSANVPPDAGEQAVSDWGFTALPDRRVEGHRRRRAVVRDRLHRARGT